MEVETETQQQHPNAPRREKICVGTAERKGCGKSFMPKFPRQQTCDDCHQRELADQQEKIQRQEAKRKSHLESQRRYLAKKAEINEGELYFTLLREAAFYASHRLTDRTTGYNSDTFFGKPVSPETDQDCCEKIYEVEQFIAENGLDALKPVLDEDRLYFERKTALTICRGFQHRVLGMPTYSELQAVPVTPEGREELCRRFPNFGNSVWGKLS